MSDDPSAREGGERPPASTGLEAEGKKVSLVWMTGTVTVFVLLSERAYHQTYVRVFFGVSQFFVSVYIHAGPTLRRSTWPKSAMARM